MPESNLLVCSGDFFSILWGEGFNGRCQARDYYDALDMGDQVKASILFRRMADVGKIYDTTKFNQETKKLYVFKPQPHRFFCFFMRGKRIIIVSAYQKQTDKAPQKEIARAEKLRLECMEQIARKEGRHGKKKD